MTSVVVGPNKMLVTKSLGASAILIERNRQINSEGYSIDDDIKNNPKGQLVLAAVQYLYWAVMEYTGTLVVGISEKFFWPWPNDTYKPKGYLKDLIRGGALIAAEIDRVAKERRLEHVD